MVITNQARSHRRLAAFVDWIKPAPDARDTIREQAGVGWHFGVRHPIQCFQLVTEKPRIENIHFNFLLRLRVDHILVVVLKFLARPLRRMSQQITVFVHRAPLNRHIGPQRG